LASTETQDSSLYFRNFGHRIRTDFLKIGRKQIDIQKLKLNIIQQCFYDNLSIVTLVDARVQGPLLEELSAAKGKNRDF
jgi:hypothetical protein